MKPHPKAEAERWLTQVRSDLAFAEVGVREGYVPTRGPSALPAGTPADVFSEAQASEAVAYARRLVEAAAALIG
jgi:HEPN domain-containing protein